MTCCGTKNRGIRFWVGPSWQMFKFDVTIQESKNSEVAFTGRLASMSRQEAFSLVQQIGCTPRLHLTKRTEFLVVGMLGWPLLPDGTVSNKLRRAEILRGQGQTLSILSEADFLELSGRIESPTLSQKTYTAHDVCEILSLDAAQVDRWDQFGLVRSTNGLYDFQDLVSLQTLMDLVSRGVRPETIAASLLRWAEVLPGTDRPLAQLRILAQDSSTILADFGQCWLEPSGQCLFRFDGLNEGEAGERDASADAALAHCLIPLPLQGSANSWFEQGQLFEDEDRFTEAEGAYQRALTLTPDFPEACFNLGNVLRELGRLEESEGMFIRAVSIDFEMAWAWYNLGDVQAELGKGDAAIESLRQALEVSPLYADAHFNLATCLQQSGRLEEARTHWEAYLRIDPASRWADIAREHLAESVC